MPLAPAANPAASPRAAALALVAAIAGAGCVRSSVPLVIGRKGDGPGCLLSPRGIAARDGRVLVLDRTGRCVRFLADGTPDGGFRTVAPDRKRGFPLGAWLEADGTAVVAHTHDGQIVRYGADGREASRHGEPGTGAPRLCMPQRVCPDPAGGWWVTDFGYPEVRRVQGFSRGFAAPTVSLGAAEAPASFLRPFGVAATSSPAGTTVWVADATHRIVRFRDGRFLDAIGGPGAAKGRLSLPTGLAAHPDGGVVVCEAANHRLQWFGEDGVSRGTYGSRGDAPGSFFGPLDVACDGTYLFVADTDNHRVQRIELAVIDWSRETDR